jgi:FkbM family methyltransferase
VSDRAPNDHAALCARARTLLANAPAEAVVMASELLDSIPLESPVVRDVVITLAEALTAARHPADVIELERSCRARWPKLASLRYLAGLAHGELGHVREMVAAFEQCIAIGEDEGAVRVVGAGSHLPLFRLGLFAEASGERSTARTFHARALQVASDFAPSRQALAALDASARRAPGVAPRSFENDTVAMKPCRHGVMTYPVHDMFVGRALDLYGQWCEDELETIGALVEPGSTVVDVGANIGSHTVYLARHVGPAGTVVALEPQSFAYGLLAANIATNGFANTRCLRVAAGRTPGKVHLPVLDPRSASNFGAVAVGAASGTRGTEAVEAITIDALALASCALIKIDVEGMEVDVLAGARETIARLRPVVFVENNTIERSAAILTAVRELGYRAYWHIAPYYRSDNHFANPEDVFAQYQPEANLVCVPRDRAPTDAFAGMLEVAGDDDDFVKALTRAGAMQTRRVTGRTTKKAAGHAAAPLHPAPAETASAKAPRAAKAPMLTVVACIPGREFSGRFFDSWNAFAERCHLEGINLVVSRQYDAVVYYARNRVLGGDVRRGPKQAPWGGELAYDYMLWIDSDIVFRFEDFQALLAHKVDLAAGLYLMADGARFSAVERMDEELFRKEGQFEFLTPEKLEGKTGLIPVDYCGFGFVLARRGVFERVEYPWFRPIFVDLPGGMREFTSEDVGFCLEAKRAGLQMNIDPNVVVGHEKAVVLTPKRRAP